MLHYLKTWLAVHLPKDEKGQDLAEYALLIAFIAILLIAAVQLLGTNIDAVFDTIGARIGSWTVP
jgi:pilus assembly protein Flp/PilA